MARLLSVPRTSRVRWLVTVLLAWLVAVPMVVAASPVACACSCAWATTQEFVDNADLVAVGEIRRVTERRERWTESPWHYEVDVALTQVYRGPTEPLITVRTATQSSACGIDPVVGQQIMLFARADGQGWGTTLCSGTRTVTDDFAAEVKALAGQGTAVTPPPRLPEPSPDGAEPPPRLPEPSPDGADLSWTPMVVVALLLAGLGAAAAVVGRRRR